jgi:hypothetical protein
MSDVSNDLDLAIEFADRKAAEITDAEDQRLCRLIACYLRDFRSLTNSPDILGMIADTVSENRQLKARNQGLLESNNTYLENYRKALAALETMREGVRGIRGQGDMLSALDQLLS